MITIGIMTGNSLDGLDAVMTAFEKNNSISNMACVSLPYSFELRRDMLALREEITALESDMGKASRLPLFKQALEAYTQLAAEAVGQLLQQSGIEKKDVAAIGLHGQSAGAHNPPSLAGGGEPFTTQIFDAAKLAKLTGIPVVYDFRSDDIFNGGEGAPLAPMHNLHLSYALSKKGVFPVCFINGGNTANVALVSSGKTLRKQVCGYDCGPFNHYVDMLAQAFYGKDFDEDGRLAAGVHINSMLLRDLYNEAALTPDGDNFLDLVPPKSAGPHLYNMGARLQIYPLTEADILRTTSYFAAYTVFLSLRFLPKELDFPRHFLMFGGGWRNPQIYWDFINLLTGRSLVLPEHKDMAEEVRSRLRGQKFRCAMADEYGLSGRYMEAQLMADMARCFLEEIPFTAPEITGCRQASICGIICRPGENTRRRGRGFTYSRAAKGWQKEKNSPEKTGRK